MRSLASALAFALALVVVPACRSAPAESPRPEPWVATLDRAHPLVGRIWREQGEAFVDRAELERIVSTARFVLLGEKHDAVDHHRLQAELLGAMVRAGRRPALVLEMADVDQQPAIDRWRATPNPKPEGLADALAWDRSGWPPFAAYAPIVQVALDAGLPILGGNYPTRLARGLARHGAELLSPTERARLGLDDPWPDALVASLRDELRDAHCGAFAEEMLAPMMLAQRARDGSLASVMLDAEADGAVLVAGAGHARRDRGVPRVLARRVAPGDIVSVAFVEVASGEVAPLAYGRAWNVARPPFDAMWFTPRRSDEDPCASLRKPK
jgi:uncharacterized iron-regulated protein